MNTFNLLLYITSNELLCREGTVGDFDPLKLLDSTLNWLPSVARKLTTKKAS